MLYLLILREVLSYLKLINIGNIINFEIIHNFTRNSRRCFRRSCVIIECRAFLRTARWSAISFLSFFLVRQSPSPSLATGVRGTVKGLCDRDPVSGSPNRAVVVSGTGWRGGHEGRERGLLKIGFDYTITRISAAVARVRDRGTEVFTSGVISGFFFARANFLTRRSPRGLISEKKVISWKRKSDILHPEEKDTTPKEVEREIFTNRERERKTSVSSAAYELFASNSMEIKVKLSNERRHLTFFTLRNINGKILIADRFEPNFLRIF